MGILWSRRVGSDPYYLSYEKSFEKITSKESQIKERGLKRRKRWQEISGRSTFASAVWAVGVAAAWGWVGKQQLIVPYSRLWQLCVGLSLGVLFLLIALAVVLKKVLSVLEQRDGVYLKRLQESRKRMLKELKDATHYEKTMALLKKYDPESQPPPPPPQRMTQTTPRTPGPIVPAANKTPTSMLIGAGNLAFGAAGKALAPMFDTIANNMIGDNPQLLDALRRAEQEVAYLRSENASLKQQLATALGEKEPLLLCDAPPSPDTLPDTGRIETDANGRPSRNGSVAVMAIVPVDGMIADSQDEVSRVSFGQDLGMFGDQEKESERGVSSSELIKRPVRQKKNGARDVVAA